MIHDMDIGGCVPGEDTPPECHLDDAAEAAARDGRDAAPGNGRVESAAESAPRDPPAFPASEEDLLVCVVQDPAIMPALLAAGVDVDAYTSTDARLLWPVLRDVYRRDTALAHSAIIDELQRRRIATPDLDAWLRKAEGAFLVRSELPKALGRVQEARRLRAIISQASRIVDGAYAKNRESELAPLIARLAAIGEAGAAANPETASTPTAALTCLASVEPEPVRWLWENVFPRGMVSLLCGDPGLGKSHLTLDLAARISVGAAMPNGSPGVNGEVVLMSAEDAMAQTVVPRLVAAGADRSRIHHLDGQRVKAEDGTTQVIPINLDNVRIIDNACEQHHPAAIFIDPVSSYMGEADSHKNADVRGLLRPLSDLATQHDCAVILISHLTKSPGTKAAYRAIGSLAFMALARSAWIVVDDPKVKEDRLLACVKSNIGPSNRGWRFRRLVDGRIQWDAEGIEITAAEALQRSESARADGEPERGPLPLKREACVTWLRQQLVGGPKLTARVLAAGELAGYKPQTFKDARKALGVDSFQKSIPGPWWMRLPPSSPEEAETSIPKTTSSGSSGGQLCVFDAPGVPEDGVLGRIGSASVATPPVQAAPPPPEPAYDAPDDPPRGPSRGMPTARIRLRDATPVSRYPVSLPPKIEEIRGSDTDTSDTTPPAQAAPPPLEQDWDSSDAPPPNIEVEAAESCLAGPEGDA